MDTVDTALQRPEGRSDHEEISSSLGQCADIRVKEQMFPEAEAVVRVEKSSNTLTGSLAAVNVCLDRADDNYSMLMLTQDRLTLLPPARVLLHALVHVCWRRKSRLSVPVQT